MTRRLATTPMAKCCPLRRAVRDGFCKLHQARLLTVLTTDGESPKLCTHCKAPPPGWQRGGDMCHCFYCGQEWTRYIAVVG